MPPRLPNACWRGRWLVMAAGILGAVLGAAAAWAQQAGSLDIQTYLDQLPPVQREEGYLGRQLREYRTFPHLDRAYQMMAANRLQDASAELEKYLAIDPADLRVRTTYMVLLYQQRNYSGTVGQADRILEAQPRFVPALLYRGLARQSLGEADAARGDFEEAAAAPQIQRVDRIFSLNMAADLALQQKDYAGALESLETLAGLQQNFSNSFRQGLSLEALDRLEEAETVYRGALDLAGTPEERFTAYRAVAEAAKKREEWGSAYDALQSAHELRPEEADVVADLGHLAYTRKDYREAARWMRQALVLRPNLQDREFLANVLDMLRDYGAAVGEWTQMLAEVSADEDRHRIFIALGNVYRKWGRVSEANRAFQEAARLQRDEPQTLAALSLGLEQEGRLREAIQVDEQAIRARSTPQAHLRLAMLLSKVGEDERALPHLEEAARGEWTREERSAIHKEEGLILFRLGRYREAQQALENAMSANPQDATLYDSLGETCLKLGAYPEITGCLDRLVTRQPSPKWVQALAVAHAEAGNTEQAIQTYRQLLGILPVDSPQRLDVLTNIANLESRRGNTRAAAASSLEAFERGGPSHWPALLQAALSFATAEQWPEAAQANLRLSELERVPASQRADALERLGFAYSQLGDAQAAAEAFRKAIEAGRDNWQFRQNLGYQLSRAGRWEEALEHFLKALEGSRTPPDLINVANLYINLKKPAEALPYLEEALAGADQLGSNERRGLYATLGYLYAGKEEFPRAVELWTRAQALRYDPTLELSRGRTQRVLGRLEEALGTLEKLDPGSLPVNLQAERWMELAQIYRSQGQPQKAIEALQQANTLEPSAERSYQIGLNYIDLKQTPQAIPYFEQAVASARNNMNYMGSLAYAYKEINRLEDAARLFEGMLQQQPDSPGLSLELAYLYLRLSNNRRATELFRQTIDKEAVQPTHSPEEEQQQRERLYRLRSEVASLTRPLHLSFYLAPSSAKRQLAAVPAALGGGGLPGQGGVEVSYQPPKIGLRDGRVLQIFSRVLWNFRPGSLESQEDSFQGGVGFRYKPLKNLNFFLGGERLFKIGEFSTHNWLLRGQYSWGRGLGLEPERGIWNYTSFYTDLAYFARDPKRWAGYGEFRQGFTVNVGDTLLITPHGVANLLHQNPGFSISSYAEGGGGVSLKFLFPQTHYAAHVGSFEILAHYRYGRFLREADPGASRYFHGWLITGILQF